MFAAAASDEAIPPCAHGTEVDSVAGSPCPALSDRRRAARWLHRVIDLPGGLNNADTEEDIDEEVQVVGSWSTCAGGRHCRSWGPAPSGNFEILLTERCVIEHATRLHHAGQWRQLGAYAPAGLDLSVHRHRRRRRVDLGTL